MTLIYRLSADLQKTRFGVAQAEHPTDLIIQMKLACQKVTGDIRNHSLHQIEAIRVAQTVSVSVRATCLVNVDWRIQSKDYRGSDGQ